MTSSIRFRGNGPGENAFARAFHSAGSMDSWVEAFASVRHLPRVSLAVYAALAAPLLERLGRKGFVVDWCGQTSTGKTTTLRLGASVWGRPDESAQDGLILSFDATKVAVERHLSLLNGLPLFLDDTKTARDKEALAEIVYLAHEGRGRARGNTTGLDVTAGFRAIVLATGEELITEATKDGGVKTRVLELWGGPFDGADGDTARLVRNLNRAVKANYGWAGPLFVRRLLALDDRWAELAEQADAIADRYAEDEGGAVARLADYCATIDVAGMLAHEYLPLPWSYQSPCEALWQDIKAEVEEGDRAREAFIHAIDWAFANMRRFVGREVYNNDGTPREPQGGFAGSWEYGDQYRQIAFLRNVFDNEVLKSAGFDPMSTKRQWRERGWIEVEGGDRNGLTKKVSFPRRDDGLNTMPSGEKRCVVIPRSAIDEVYFGDDSVPQSDIEDML